MINFIECIKIKDEEIFHLPLHIERMNATVRKFYAPTFDFSTLEIVVPADKKNGLYKCRIMYNSSIQSVEFLPYTKRNISELVFIKMDNINYNYKFANRQVFENFTKDLQPHQENIFVKNGLLTDSSFSNICLYNGTEWHTPALPLLAGTKRKQLLADKKIIEKTIPFAAIKIYQKISFINAMLDLGDVETYI